MRVYVPSDDASFRRWLLSEGLWRRFLLPWHIQTHMTPHLPLFLSLDKGQFKNILLYVEKVAMMGPPTLQLPLY